MPRTTSALVTAIDTELTAARTARMTGDTGTAFRHLERAHILSQRVTRRHVRVHWEMLRVGVRVRDRREVTGQITRMAAAALFSRLWVPSGNTGRSSVSALKPMPVPADLRAVLEQQSRATK